MPSDYREILKEDTYMNGNALMIALVVATTILVLLIPFITKKM